MFSPADREALRDALIALARDDERIASAALTGSAALDGGDDWSDVDLAFGLSRGVDRSQLIAEWTARMYEKYGAVHHTDVVFGNALFRVFLLRSTLQVDLAFWPEAEFGPIGFFIPISLTASSLTINASVESLAMDPEKSRPSTIFRFINFTKSNPTEAGLKPTFAFLSFPSQLTASVTTKSMACGASLLRSTISIPGSRDT